MLFQAITVNKAIVTELDYKQNTDVKEELHITSNHRLAQKLLTVVSSQTEELVSASDQENASDCPPDNSIKTSVLHGWII